MKTYYKVVSENLNSVLARGEHLEITYKIGEFVEPKIKGTGLLVFDNFVEAKMFSNGFILKFHRIFECVCENELPLPTYRCRDVAFGVCLSDLLDCWARLRYNSRNTWPTSTRAFQRVKLIKEIL